jgi:hypothetical protein
MRRFSSLTLASLTLSTLALAACGDDGGGDGGKGKAVDNAQVIEQGKATATATTQLTTLMTGTDSAAAQGPVMQVGNAMNSLVTQYRAVKLQAQAGGLSSAELAQAVENTVNYTGDHFSANLVYDQTGIQFSYVVELDMPAVDGGRQIDGTFDMNYEATSAQYNIKYAYNGVYTGFTMDAAGCATAGTIAIDYTWDVSGAIFDQLPSDQRAAIKDQIGGDGTVTLEFGPACGDVAVFAK